VRCEIRWGFDEMMKGDDNREMRKEAGQVLYGGRERKDKLVFDDLRRKLIAKLLRWDVTRWEGLLYCFAFLLGPSLADG